MTVHARPEPDDAPQLAPTTHELLVTAQRTASELQRALSHQLDALTTPGQLRGPFRLNAAAPRKTDDVGDSCLAFTILNPNPVVIYLGVAGSPARPGQGAITVPPNSLMTLPLGVTDLELGVDVTDPATSTGDAVVHVIRYSSTQPAFLGAL